MSKPKAQLHSLTCETCGKTFVHKRATRIYCSVRCMGEANTIKEHEINTRFAYVALYKAHLVYESPWLLARFYQLNDLLARGHCEVLGDSVRLTPNGIAFWECEIKQYYKHYDPKKWNNIPSRSLSNILKRGEV